MIKKYLKIIQKYLFLEVVCNGLHAITNAALIFIIGKSLSFKFKSFLEINILIVVLISIVCLSILLFYIKNNLANIKEKVFYSAFRKDLFDSFLLQNEDFRSNLNLDKLTASIDNDTKMMYSSFILPFSEILISLLYLLVYIIFLIQINFYAAMLVISCCLFCSLVPKILNFNYSKKKDEYLNQRNLFTSINYEFISSSNIYDKNNITSILGHIFQEIENVTKKLYNYGLCRAKNISLISLFSNLNHILLFILIAFLLNDKLITAGMILVIFDYYTVCSSHIENIIRSYNDCTSIEDIQKRLSNEFNYDITKFMNIENIENDIQCLELHNVHSLPNNKYLKFLKLERQGQYLLLGKNGVGKSTILKIISGNFPYTGTLKVNNHVMENYDMTQLISYCSQSNYIIDANFNDNITLFGTYSKNNNDHLLRYLEINHPNIVNSCNCLELSEGEKQLVCIFRTLLSQKPILLFDEPFSNLEINLKQEICKQILSLSSNIVIIIDHNYSDIKSLFSSIIYLNSSPNNPSEILVDVLTN